MYAREGLLDLPDLCSSRATSLTAAEAMSKEHQEPSPVVILVVNPALKTKPFSMGECSRADGKLRLVLPPGRVAVYH